jgi:hypothetical protein
VAIRAAKTQIEMEAPTEETLLRMEAGVMKMPEPEMALEG